MSQAITVSHADILHQAKLACQIPTLAEGIAIRKIITAAAAETGITIETAELQQAADRLRLINQLKSTDATWAWLQTHDLSLDEFEEMIYTNLLSGKLAQHLFADKVDAYFVEHQLDYTGAVMYEVLLEDRDLAMELFYSIQEQEVSFFEVAHQYIQEPGLRRAVGYRGIINRRDLKPELSAAVFAANPPQILKPILTAKGIHLILVEEIIQAQLDQDLHNKILAELFENWLKIKIKSAQIIRHFEISSQVA